MKNKTHIETVTNQVFQEIKIMIRFNFYKEAILTLCSIVFIIFL